LDHVALNELLDIACKAKIEPLKAKIEDFCKEIGTAKWYCHPFLFASADNPRFRLTIDPTQPLLNSVVLSHTPSVEAGKIFMINPETAEILSCFSGLALRLERSQNGYRISQGIPDVNDPKQK
jgi:hypothetical protein